MKPCRTPSYRLSSYHSQSAFTLIELMVALVLGLLISAAALQLFFNSSNSLRIQEGADDVQEAAVFSLSYMLKEIAMANLGAYRSMTQESAWTGVVLTGSNDHATETLANGDNRQIGNLRGVKGADSAYLTTTAIDSSDPNSNVKIGGDTVNSDQLTIQYRAPFDMLNCEGTKVAKGDIVIERFFTRKDTTRVSGESDKNAIVLACDAAEYELNKEVDPMQVAKDAYTLSGMGEKGEMLVQRVDYFKVLLGVQSTDGLIYLSPKDYMSKPGADYRYNAPIVAVQIGVITRGTNPVSGETQSSFDVLGTTVKIDDDSQKYVRRVYESTIRLRNGLTQ